MFFNKSKKLLIEKEKTLNQIQNDFTETKDKLTHTAEILNQTKEELQKIKSENTELTVKYSPFIEKDKVIDDFNLEIAKLKNDLVILNEKYQNGLAIKKNLIQLANKT